MQHAGNFEGPLPGGIDGEADRLALLCVVDGDAHAIFFAWATHQPAFRCSSVIARSKSLTMRAAVSLSPRTVKCFDFPVFGSRTVTYIRLSLPSKTITPASIVDFRMLSRRFLEIFWL